MNFKTLHTQKVSKNFLFIQRGIDPNIHAFYEMLDYWKYITKKIQEKISKTRSGLEIEAPNALEYILPIIWHLFINSKSLIHIDFAKAFFKRIRILSVQCKINAGCVGLFIRREWKASGVGKFQSLNLVDTKTRINWVVLRFWW